MLLRIWSRHVPQIGGLGHRLPRPHHAFEHGAAALFTLVEFQFDGLAAQRFFGLLAFAQQPIAIQGIADPFAQGFVDNPLARPDLEQREP